jgi:hypothetical protein
VYQRSQVNQAPPPSDHNVKSRLNTILDRTSGLHGRLDGLIESMFGAQPEEAANVIGLGSSAPSMTYTNLLDAIEFRLQGIDHAIEFLSARL